MHKSPNRFKYNLRIFSKAFLPWALSSPRHLWLTLNLFGKVWKKYKLNLHLQKEEVFEEKYPYGARLGCFIEYIPTGRSPDPKLSHAQRFSFRQWFLKLKERANTYLIHFPGDEELMDNCREAEKGFIHINPEGYTESCALIPNSKYNVTKMPLELCLKKMYRDNQQGAHLYKSFENHPCMSRIIG